MHSSAAACIAAVHCALVVLVVTGSTCAILGLLRRRPLLATGLMLLLLSLILSELLTGGCLLTAWDAHSLRTVDRRMPLDGLGGGADGAGRSRLGLQGLLPRPLLRVPAARRPRSRRTAIGCRRIPRAAVLVGAGQVWLRPRATTKPIARDASPRGHSLHDCLAKPPLL
jgi:hypothetical protein